MWLNKRFDLALAFALMVPAPFARADDDVLTPVTDVRVNSPKEALRTRIFGAEAAKPGCATLVPDKGGGYASIEKELDFFVTTLLTALRKQDDKALQPLFHNRLNTSLAAINDTYGRLDLTYGKRQDISVYKLWALNSVDGSPVGVPCDGGQQKVFALYGYPLQFGIWLQVMGPKELGRIYVGVVPAGGRWNIGSFHLQQWTVGGKDYESWGKDAIKASAAGHKESAYALFDIAAKLVDAGNYVEIPLRADVVKARDALYTSESWDKMLKEFFKEEKVVYTATMIVEGNAGILIRMEVPGEVSVEHIQSTCTAMANKLLTTAWAADLHGIRCGFNLPREKPSDEGLLGSIFVTFADAKASAEKAAKKAAAKK